MPRNRCLKGRERASVLYWEDEPVIVPELTVYDGQRHPMGFLHFPAEKPKKRRHRLRSDPFKAWRQFREEYE
jgi:hypothetical protein